MNAAVESFGKFDLDGDGELDEDELDEMFTKCGITLSTPQVRQVIAYCDADKNGQVSLKELRWLLTCEDDIASDLDFNDPPDVKRWLQKEFLPQDPEFEGWKTVGIEFAKSFAPIARIIIILLLTLILVMNYCDYFNPMDSLRNKVQAAVDARNAEPLAESCTSALVADDSTIANDEVACTLVAFVAADADAEPPVVEAAGECTVVDTDFACVYIATGGEEACSATDPDNADDVTTCAAVTLDGIGATCVAEVNAGSESVCTYTAATAAPAAAGDR